MPSIQEPWKGDRQFCRPSRAYYIDCPNPGLRYGATAPSLARGYSLFALPGLGFAIITQTHVYKIPKSPATAGTAEPL